MLINLLQGAKAVKIFIQPSLGTEDKKKMLLYLYKHEKPL